MDERVIKELADKLEMPLDEIREYQDAIQNTLIGRLTTLKHETIDAFNNLINWPKNSRKTKE